MVNHKGSPRRNFRDSSIRILRCLTRPEWCYLIIALLMGSFFAVMIPAGGGADEPSHILRAQTVAEGSFKVYQVDRNAGVHESQKHDANDSVLYGGTVDSALYNTAVHNMINFQVAKDKGGQRGYSFPTWRTPDLETHGIFGQKQQRVAFSNTAVNSPFAYLPAIIGFWTARAFTNNAYAIILGMRLAGVLTLALIVFFCIKAIPLGKWVLATVSLIPATIVILSSVTADTMTYAMCVAYITVVLRCSVKADRLSRQDWAWLTVTTVCLAFIKLTYLPLGLLLVLIPIFNNCVRKKQDLVKIALIGFSTIFLFLLWYLSISHINTGAMFGTQASPLLQKQFIAEHPSRFFVGLIKQFASQNFFNVGGFGPLDAHGHWPYTGWVTILAFCLAVALVDFREYGVGVLHAHATVFVGIVLLTLISVFVLVETALYLQFTSVGANFIGGVQARYFLPILPLLLISVITITSRGAVLERDDRSLIRQKNTFVTFPTISMLSVQWLSVIFMLFVAYSTFYKAS